VHDIRQHHRLTAAARFLLAQARAEPAEFDCLNGVAAAA
jgi:hypothetical protein